jgi:predicted Rossmann fold nucleotide-binding protein DprA/Smf involved in DNA uptake
LYGLLSVEDAGHMDDLVENSDWRLAKVLGALFDRELRGVIRQLPGKQFLKVLL